MSKNKTSRIKVLGIGLAAVLALAGCGASTAEPAATADGPWGAVQAAAKAQGTVRVYSVAVPAQNEAIVKAFEKKHPDIKVEMVRGATELPARVTGELNSGSDGADVFLYAGQQWFLDNKDKLIDVQGPSSAGWPTEGYALPGAPLVSVVPAGFITWNTEVFPKGFKDWNDVLDPSVKGKLGMRDIVDIVVGSHLAFLEDTNGSDYLPSLAAQDAKLYESVSPMTQAVASGEIGVSLISTPAIVKDLQSKGAPIEYKIPEKSWASVYLASALKGSKRPEAGQVFVDYLMSPEGQAALNGDSFGGSFLKDVPGAVDISGMTRLDAATFTPARVEEWKAKFAQMFGASKKAGK
ncbi:MAG: hypothetical protein JWQ56_1734 [Pseudarthrobacter sp.]|nr:hypothetical protein [Pseudarthrobacter sp.]